MILGLALSMNGNVAAFAGLVLGKQEAQQEHHRGSRSEQPVDLDVGEGLSLCDHHVELYILARACWWAEYGLRPTCVRRFVKPATVALKRGEPVYSAKTD